MDFRNFLSIFSLQKNLIPKKVLRNYSSFEVKPIKTHKNDVKTVYFPKDNFYTKFSTSKKAITKIDSELQGLKWYCNRLGLKKKYIIKNYYEDKNFALIDLKNILGRKIKSWDSLSVNFNFLKKSYFHYIKYSPKQKLVKIHGDLTLDNILFMKNKMFIIDWEFFKAKKSFFGYDIAYLFLSAACLPYLKNKKFSKNDEFYFIKLWKLLMKIKISKKLIYDPFNYFANKIKNDKILKRSYLLSKSKFFPFITPSSHKKKIIKIIKKIKYEQ